MLLTTINNTLVWMSGFASHFGFIIFVIAMAALIFMPSADKPAPAPKPAEGDSKADEHESKWRKMLYENEVKWRRMLFAMHIQNKQAQPPAAAPIQIYITPTPGAALPTNAAEALKLAGGQAVDNGKIIDGEVVGAPPTPEQTMTCPRRGGRFGIPKLRLPRPRVAANRRSDQT